LILWTETCHIRRPDRRIELEAMNRRMDISRDSLAGKVVELVFFLGALSLVLYAVLTGCRPFTNSLSSQIAYWTSVVILSVAWLCVANSVLRTNRFEIRPGVIKRYESRLLVFRSQKSYGGDAIDRIDVKVRKSHFVFPQKYRVVLLLRSGTEMTLGEFRNEKQAHEIRARINETIRDSQSSDANS